MGKHVVTGIGKYGWVAALAGPAVLVGNVGEHLVPGLVKDLWLDAFAGKKLLVKHVVPGLGRDFSSGIMQLASDLSGRFGMSACLSLYDLPVPL